MERLEKDRLRELVRNREWRSRMLSALTMTDEKGEDDLEHEETEMLVDYLCRLVPETPEYPDLDDAFEEYLRNEEKRRLERELTLSFDSIPKGKPTPPPEPDPDPEPYAPWRTWKPEEWRAFLEDTGVGERSRPRKDPICEQVDELLGMVKEDRRRRERRRKQILWVGVWAVLLQLGGICCGFLWRVAAVVGDCFSLPTWTAWGLLGLLVVMGVLAVRGLTDAFGDLFGGKSGEDDWDEEYCWDEDEEE